MSTTPDTPADLPFDDRDRCPNCFGTAFTWGAVRTSSTRLNFEPAKQSFWQIITESRPVKARCCNECGNLQLFAEIGTSADNKAVV